jgi:hypothetical protein
MSDNSILSVMIQSAANSPANPVYKKDLTPLISNLMDLNSSSAPVAINDTIVMTGTTAATTTTYMQYAYNVVNTATPTGFAARLPNPPTKGKSCVIVNLSGIPIVLYPSVTEGSINGVINGSALIPSDGNAYTFFCYENPLPGAWSWTAPATNQYDSKEIVVSTPGGSNVITCVAPSFYNTSAGRSSSGGGSTDPLFSKNVPGVNGWLTSIAKPSSTWNSITKVKIYTNILTLDGGTNIGLSAGGAYTVVNNSTGVESGIVSVNSNSYVTEAASTWQTVPGTPAAGAFSANIGDAGTKYIELPCTFFSPNGTFSVNSEPTLNSTSSTFGSVFLGTEVQTSSGISYNKWFTQYFWLYIIPRGSAGGQLKVRFFIEYN